MALVRYSFINFMMMIMMVMVVVVFFLMMMLVLYHMYFGHVHFFKMVHVLDVIRDVNFDFPEKLNGISLKEKFFFFFT